MSVEIVVESDLAKALQNVVQPKLVEMGWSSGLQDDTLSEYIILMLANGKSQEQIASELSTDLLDLGPEDQSTIDFARWLFQQVDLLNAQINGASAQADDSGMADAQEMQAPTGPAADANDAEMGDATGGSGTIPTGPKSMRNGTQQKTRDRRMLGQMNKTLTQSNDSALHRVRGTTGTGRINSHSSRDPPRGPRNQQLQRNLNAASNRPMGNVQAAGAMGTNGQMQQGFMANQGDPMQMFAVLAEQAQMMAQQMQQMGMPGMFPQGGANGRSMFDRVNNGRPNRGHHDRRQHGNRQHQQNAGGQDANMAENGAAADAQMGETKEPAHTVCRFDTTCTKPDCHFAHHSPIARPGTVLGDIDTNTECSYGLACMNPHCPNRHPSRAKKAAHQAEQECNFGLFCQKPNCPFKHPPPTMKPCRNGADCTTEGCPFWHSKIECKHAPCKNPMCPYKHKEGQKLTSFGDHVWTANGNNNHVSERKFVAEDGAEEELIIPEGQATGQQAQAPIAEATMTS